jgi:hypothetical protein
LDGKQVAADCRASTGLSAEVVLGLNFAPASVDVVALERSLSRREFTAQEFKQFCLSSQLAPDPNDVQSAARCLVYVHGQSLAWLHLPAEREGLAMAMLVRDWVSNHDHVITDGLTERHLDHRELAGLWP